MPDYPALKTRFGENCLFDVPAERFTTYRAGGRAEVLVSPADAGEIVWLTGWCRDNSVPLLVLGRGSNVLVSDRGLPGVVLLTERLSKIEVSGGAVIAQAGVLWDEVARITAEYGLPGLEKTSGVPGSVGGALRMNAGAYGQETFDRLAYIEAADAEGRIFRLPKKDISYGYRRVRGLEGLVLLSAGFEFASGEAPPLLKERSVVLASRAAKQPLDFPSAGSVFKRPPGDYASRLIDAAGLKGLKIGGAEVSSKHAGFIVNTGGAAAADIYALMCEVRLRVKEKTGVDLELEQILLGDF